MSSNWLCVGVKAEMFLTAWSSLHLPPALAPFSLLPCLSWPGASTAISLGALVHCSFSVSSSLQFGSSRAQSMYLFSELYLFSESFYGFHLICVLSALPKYKLYLDF